MSGQAGAPTRPDGDRDILHPGQVVLDRYQVVAKLGQGGMGAVYSVLHTKTNRDLALKVLFPTLVAHRPSLVKRFEAEARAAAALRHRAIVEIVDMDSDGDRHFIVMEKLEGEELLARINREHPLPISWVVKVGIEIADAMSVAHEHKPKIVHRDLKPQNIFLARNGREVDIVKILDFGIAKLIEEDGLSHTLTETGDVYGTPLYMSPEQLRSAKDVDERTDVYAMGVILYQALSGKTPFAANSFADLVVKVTTEAPRPLAEVRPEVPAPLAAIVARAMARRPENRFVSAGQFRDALVAFAEGHSDGAVAGTPPLRAALEATLPTSPARDEPTPRAGTPAPGGRVRRRVIIGLAVVAVLTAAGVGLRGALAPRAQRPLVTNTPPVNSPAPVSPTLPDRPPPAPVQSNTQPVNELQRAGSTRPVQPASDTQPANHDTPQGGKKRPRPPKLPPLPKDIF